MLNVTRIGSIANIVCGAWLMSSALLFRHIPTHALNALVVGALACALALLAMRWRPMLAAGNIVLGVWLFCSPMVLPGATAMVVVNAFIVGTLLFGFAAPVMAALDELHPRRSA